MSVSRRENVAAVVIPIYRLPLTAEEEQSLRQLQCHLWRYDTYFVVPESLEDPSFLLREAKVLRWADSYFEGLAGYNRLMLSRSFYRAFREYSYILICQLDSLVFSDELESWCRRGLDYVGAPWFRGHRGDTTQGLWAVGNGGFSLRKVATFLKVLEAKGLWMTPADCAAQSGRILGYPMLRRAYLRAKTFAHSIGYKNNIGYFIRHFAAHEDLFWSTYARLIEPSFRIPRPEEALGFAFEHAPRHCFALTNERLPFGCHAWDKIDREFWQPFLLTDGATVEAGLPERMPP